MNKIVVAHHKENTASKNLIERLGFIFSHEEKQAFMKNGDWIDVMHYQLLRGEYSKTK